MVGIAALGTPGLPKSTRDALWQHYWRGEPGSSFHGWGDLLIEAGLHQEPLWEWMVDGYVELKRRTKVHSTKLNDTAAPHDLYCEWVHPV